MKFRSLFAIVALFALAGCQTATPLYVQANRERLAAVKPWLTQYSLEHPEKALRVGDVVKTWEFEVSKQSATTQPAR